jgi:glycosyltransferase involved in cell wall biosynthesis
MRILIAHSRYLSGAASGENSVVDDEAHLLREGGHDVMLWDPSPEGLSGLGLVRKGVQAVWSRPAVEHVRDLVRAKDIEIVHVHNLFPLLSPAVLRVGSAEGLSVVVTLHSYRLLCLPATFVRDGRICEDCLGRTPWPGVVHACYRGTHVGSAAVAGSLALHRAVGTFEGVHLYLAVSSFLRQKYLEAGWNADRIAVKSNFARPQEQRDGPGEYFLFLGRLAPEKGVDTLMEVWSDVSAKLLVVGDGPEGSRLRSMAPAGVEFLGTVQPSQVASLVRRARAVLVPSRWYEGQPRTILEAYAAGVPVIASRVGGLPEVVEEDTSGLLVGARDRAGWTEALDRLRDDAEAARLGAGAYATWKAFYTPEQGLLSLEQAYRQAASVDHLPGNP